MNVEELAEEHWEYTGKVIYLSKVGLKDEDEALMRFLYIEAFKHGYKHAKEEL